MQRLQALFMLSMIAICGSALSAHAERWTVTKANGGPDGYGVVKSETNDPLIGETSHTLTCENAGHESCIFASTSTTRHPYLIGYADAQIIAGHLTGDYSTTVNGVPAHVYWNATDQYNATITEEQADVQ